MVKLNSTTAILSDLDGVILNLDYDIKFWESWLPEHVANQSNQSLDETKAKIQAEIDIQRGTLNFYDLNYWDDLLNVDCMQIIKEQEEKCSYLEGSYEALQKLSTLKNPKHILTNGDDKIKAITIKDDEGKIKKIDTDYILGFFGLIMKLGPIAEWGLNLDKKHIPVNTESFQTNKEGIFAIGDICTYPGKLKLILSGFHEGALAARECFKLARPNEKYKFEYTTTSKNIHERLGKKYI